MPDDSGAETSDPIGTFIARWDGTEQAERANYARFLDELCDVLAVPRPDPAAGPLGDYRYERGVTHREADGASTTRRIDLYKRGCFVLEAKQGANAPKQANLFGAAEAERRANVRRSPGWAQAMLKAKGQAEGYARDLPAAEGWPPFVIVCDVASAWTCMRISPAPESTTRSSPTARASASTSRTFASRRCGTGCG